MANASGIAFRAAPLSFEIDVEKSLPAQRRTLENQFERYALTQAYNVPLLWYQRIVVNNKKVNGWHLTPSHFTGQNLVNVWLDE